MYVLMYYIIEQCISTIWLHPPMNRITAIKLTEYRAINI